MSAAPRWNRLPTLAALREVVRRVLRNDTMLGPEMRKIGQRNRNNGLLCGQSNQSWQRHGRPAGPAACPICCLRPQTVPSAIPRLALAIERRPSTRTLWGPPHSRRTALHRCPWSSRAATGTPVWPAVLRRTTTKRGSSRFKRARSRAREFSSRLLASYPCAPSPLLSQCPCGRPHGGHGTPATMRSSEATRQDMYRGCDGVHQRLVCRVPESAVSSSLGGPGRCRTGI